MVSAGRESSLGRLRFFLRLWERRMSSTPKRTPISDVKVEIVVGSEEEPGQGRNWVSTAPQPIAWLAENVCV